jgi:hypothetical protein
LTLEWLKYDVQTTDNAVKTYRDLMFLPLDTFLDVIHQYDEDADNVVTFTHTLGADTFTFLCEDDRAPRYYTTFNDRTLLFDAYDSEVDTTLQQSKTLGYGKKDQTWTESDSFVPFLDPDFEILLLNEAKSLSFAELKQMQHQKADMSARKLWIKGMSDKRAINNPRSELDRLPNYGRPRW